MILLSQKDDINFLRKEIVDCLIWELHEIGIVMEIQELVKQQRRYYRSGATRSIQQRKDALRRLRKGILKYEDAIHEALYKDLHKAKMESYMSEVGMVLAELHMQLRHLEQWAKPKRVKTPLAQFPAKSFISPEPYGVVLVMAPWNYPFQLCMEPLIGALATGNTVILKPSAYAKATSAVLAKLLQDCFDERYVAVVEGGRKENTELLNQRFDYIFFTGGVTVGKIVMEKASRFLTPVTLELGGKSPCIVDESANLKLAARRIAFGKFLNAGQTCVAPDYVFVQASVQKEFLAYLQQALQQFFGKDALRDPQYPSIINEKHYQRLIQLMQSGDVCIGGQSCQDTLQIAPTVLENVLLDAPVMQEEIFGPLLPVLSYDNLQEVIAYIQEQERPLALYLFTRQKAVEERILQTCSFGGGCMNDTIIHLATSEMGFGGVGQSGMGSYHGYASFQTFSHFRSIVKKANWLDLPMRYHPYTKTKETLVRMFLR